MFFFLNHLVGAFSLAFSFFDPFPAGKPLGKPDQFHIAQVLYNSPIIQRYTTTSVVPAPTSGHHALRVITITFFVYQLNIPARAIWNILEKDMAERNVALGYRSYKKRSLRCLLSRTRHRDFLCTRHSAPSFSLPAVNPDYSSLITPRYLVSRSSPRSSLSILDWLSATHQNTVLSTYYVTSSPSLKR
ncbi:hypothetical protein H4582DRAFT_2016883 [Lactarius indigo]|nr:hypothetical protein H4582DRAFT_2016883 [Lactarius indigo]